MYFLITTIVMLLDPVLFIVAFICAAMSKRKEVIFAGGILIGISAEVLRLFLGSPYANENFVMSIIAATLQCWISYYLIRLFKNITKNN